MNQKICFYSAPFPRIQSQAAKADIALQYGMNAFEGFNNYELTTPDPEVAKRLKFYLDEKGVIMPCLSVLIDFSKDPLEDMLTRIKGYADVAKILDCPYLHHTIIPECGDPNKVIPRKKELYERSLTAVRETYDYAEAQGVKTIYEDQGYLFNGVEGFGNFLADVNREVGVVADFGNIYQSNDGLMDFLKAFVDKVVHVHIKDVYIKDENETGKGFTTINGKFMTRAPLGEGCVPFEEAVALLKQAGYDGYYSLEDSARSDDSPEVDRMLAFIENLLK